MNKDTLNFWMDQNAEELPRWVKPEHYDPNKPADRAEMQRRIEKGGAKVLRKVVGIANELFEIEHPDQKRDPAARQRFIEPMVAEGDYYGSWHYFDWSNRLVQFANPEEHWQLLTNRNRELIRAEELPIIRHKTTWHIGLSVGGSILEQTTHMGLGEKVILADPDVLSVPNLNRIHAGMPEVDMRKTDVMGIKLSELNPYVEQVHFPDGLTPDNVDEMAKHQPHLIFEEVDHLPTKIVTRRLARRFGAAHLMATDTGDLSMLDVERYDLGDNHPFLGALTAEELDMVERQDPSAAETVKLIEQLIGAENLADQPRLKYSMGQIGITLAGIAQLGTTASVGGAYAAIAGREILLGRGPATGRYKISPQEILKLR